MEGEKETASTSNSPNLEGDTLDITEEQITSNQVQETQSNKTFSKSRELSNKRGPKTGQASTSNEQSGSTSNGQSDSTSNEQGNSKSK